MKKIAEILRINKNDLADLDAKMSEVAGSGVLDRLARENKNIIEDVLTKLNNKNRSVNHVRGVLRKAIFFNEKKFLSFLTDIEGKTEFDKAANLSRNIARVGKGFFLKREYAVEILKKSRPENLLKYLGYDNIGELLDKEDIFEAFSALRFVISKKFVAKKHHNVSHLKEFGVIFLNPIKMDIPGKFLRDFALLLHYFHEIEFYSKLFRKYARSDNFALRLKSLLRGDVIENAGVVSGKNSVRWLIVQRYLWKENPEDPRLLLPRVNPESVHWARGERDLAEFGKRNADVGLELWGNMDWVGDFFKGDSGEEFVSFDLEDNAMGLVSFMEGKEEYFNYHQREAMWTKIFSEYAGGEEKMEKLIIDNFDKGIIEFG